MRTDKVGVVVTFWKQHISFLFEKYCNSLKADTIVLLRRQYSYLYINVLILFSSPRLYFLNSVSFICLWEQIFIYFHLKGILNVIFGEGEHGIRMTSLGVFTVLYLHRVIFIRKNSYIVWQVEADKIISIFWASSEKTHLYLDAGKLFFFHLETKEKLLFSIAKLRKDTLFLPT